MGRELDPVVRVGEQQIAEARPVRFVEKLRAQVRRADGICLKHDELASLFIPVENHPETEGQEQAEKAQHTAKQIAFLSDRRFGFFRIPRRPPALHPSEVIACNR